MESAQAGGDRRIRVLVGDGSPLLRAGLARLVRGRAWLELVGETADGWAALEEIRSRRPDVAVLGVGLPGLAAERVLNAVVRDGLPTRVVFLAAETRADHAYAALEAGVSGYVTTHATEDQIGDALDRVARGDSVIPPEMQTGLVREIRLRRVAPWPALTGREHAVLRRIADGRLLPEIARDLNLSIATVKTHASHLYEKLGVSERAAAVREAMRRGLLE